jgi:hypothetical protein
MARGRKANLIPSVSWHIEMPIDLAFQVEARLLDPVTRKAAYAARSKLIQSLLLNWVRETAPVQPTSPAEANSSTPQPEVLDTSNGKP